MSSPAQKRVVLPRSERIEPKNAADVARTDPQQVISVSVIVKRKNPLSVRALGGRRVSRDEFDAQYAADPASFDALRTFAHEHGLAVDESASSLARRTVVLRGTVQAMDEAFSVELHDYQDRATGRKYHSFAGQVSLPETHAPLVDAVLGLDGRPVAKPHFRLLKDLPRAADAAAAKPQAFNPPQVAALYNFPTGVTGSGQTIAILELGGGYNASDLQTYFQGLGLTPPTVVAVSVDGGANAPGDPNGADGEVALDIQVAASIATGAKIAVYFAPNTDQGFVDAITTAVHDTANNPTVLSISWGGPEASWAQSVMTSLDDACQSAAALGVTITVASGDNGSSDGETDGQNHVDFPASSPHVLACGGTELIGSGTKISSETVWNDGSNGGATGGGYSTVFPVPAWQTGVAGFAGTGRGVPDVAGDAAPESGYNILVDGEQEVVGGTSAVAPLYAALIALINQQKGTSVGFVNALLYPDAADFHDITQGNNGSFAAGPGWDACTGLGSPDGQEVAAALVG
ncbi:MAG TPA: S53 family peptidase [Acidobacteriaceae bacterium]|jgi:kumamolisin|nr:S53 family peptidase [Acidobacteriaceae bacterium]